MSILTAVRTYDITYVDGRKERKRLRGREAIKAPLDPEIESINEAPYECQ